MYVYVHNAYIYVWNYDLKLLLRARFPNKIHTGSERKSAIF